MKLTKRFIRLLLILAVVHLICTIQAFASDPFELHLLDVGQGQSVLIMTDGHAMLIDGGGRDSSSFVIGYLRQQGIEDLDCVMVSHYDEDHMAGLIGVLSVFPVKTLYIPAYTGEGELYRSLATAAFSNGCSIMHAVAGWQFPVGEASAEVIGPIGEYFTDNDQSLCVKISYGYTSYLICGDAEMLSETNLVNSRADLDVDVYVVNHHGSHTSSTDVFLEAVSPEYALISCGADNEYGHPAADTMQRLQDHGVTMFRTDKQGTIIASTDGQEIWFNELPCDDWSCGNKVFQLEETEDIKSNETVDSGSITRQIDADGSEDLCKYVCNTKTKKFHLPDCESVSDMREENKLFTDESREELLAEGYLPCWNCKP